MKPKLKLSYREQQVAEHLKEHRPKMYRELKASGQLEATCIRMWRAYADQLYDLEVLKKLPHDQAVELVREVAFPPSEKDQALLGEQPPEPTTVETTS